jgi:hypothetical protein
MMNSRRGNEQALRFEERRRREDDAPRLREQVPSLVSLQLNVDDCSGVAGGTTYIRRVVVDQAPALFVVPCGDPHCVGGEHDLTMGIMRSLRSHETSFRGNDECRGTVGLGSCLRVLRFTAAAAYQQP